MDLQMQLAVTSRAKYYKKKFASAGAFSGDCGFVSIVVV